MEDSITYPWTNIPQFRIHGFIVKDATQSLIHIPQSQKEQYHKFITIPQVKLAPLQHGFHTKLPIRSAMNMHVVNP